MDNQSSIQFYPVRGDSMHPLIREGDVVKVRTGPGEFKRADVMLYRSCGRIYCHRVVRKTDHPSSGYLLQCDNHPGHLLFVSYDNVIGRAVVFGRGTKFASLDRGLYRFFGEFIVFIGLYMRWLPNVARSIKRLVFR